MRLLVSGSRDYTDAYLISGLLHQAWVYLGSDIETVLVHGACPTGVDAVASDIWSAHGLPIEAHPAEWDKYGRSAGFRRNAEMVNLGADLCVAIIHNKSHGASHTAVCSETAGIPTWRIEV